jgi:hypothetical protein
MPKKIKATKCLNPLHFEDLDPIAQRPITMKHEEAIARFYSILKSQAEFDRQEVRGVLHGQLNLTDRERYLHACYMRLYGNIESLLKLDQRKDFQACIILARGIFEQAFDVHLMHRDLIDNWIEKMRVFTLVEHLRVAKKIAAFSKTHSVLTDVPIYQEFITKNERAINEQQERLWPSKEERKVQHWSGQHLRKRVELARSPFEELYVQHYSHFSWYVHPGPVGVANISAEGLAIGQGLAYWLAAECYREVLKIMTKEFKLSTAVPDIGDRLELARALPFFSLAGQEDKS